MSKLAVFQVVSNGADGMAQTRIDFSSLCESDRDQWFVNLGKNSCYYSKRDVVEDLKLLGKNFVAKLNGNDKMIIDLCLNSELEILSFPYGDKNITVYEKSIK